MPEPNPPSPPTTLADRRQPDEATATDEATLQATYNIGTIIDPRTTTEHIAAAQKHTASSLPAFADCPDRLVADVVRCVGGVGGVEAWVAALAGGREKGREVVRGVKGGMVGGGARGGERGKSRSLTR